MLNGIDSVLFDMDGVLVDSEAVIEAAAIQGLSKYGVNAVHEDFLPFVGAGEDKYIGGVSEKYGVPYRLEMKDLVYELYAELVFEHIKVYEGIVELLKNLKIKGYKLALASSADKIKVNLNLQAAGIDAELFDAIVCGSDVINKKPSPEVFLTAAERLRSNPKTCVVIEDAINGLKAAKAGGMKCIAITTSFKKAVLMEQGADAICSKTTEIDVLLRTLIT